ncbi:hypothetical protein Tco_0845819, partial [Tanacetum coccineum]
EDLFATNHPSGNPTSSFTSHTDLTSPEVVNQSSGNPTPISELETKSSSSSPTLISLEESELIWEEFKAYLNFSNYSLDNDLINTILEMFTDEHALDYSSLPLWDDYDDNLFDHESDNDNAYDDPFD